MKHLRSFELVASHLHLQLNFCEEFFELIESMRILNENPKEVDCSSTTRHIRQFYGKPATNMHTLLARANAIFAHASFVLSVILVLNMLTSWGPFKSAEEIDLNSGNSSLINLRVKKIEKFRQGTDYSGTNDYVLFKFDIVGDLRPAFNWNTKQLFVYIAAEYTTPQNKLNQEILWDRIITLPQKEEALINQTAVFNDYPLADQGTNMRGTKVKLTLNWNTIPISGLLGWQSGKSIEIQLPNDYII